MIKNKILNIKIILKNRFLLYKTQENNFQKLLLKTIFHNSF